MSFRSEKYGEELKGYLVNYADYLARARRSVSGLLNGLIYNVPFTASNRPAMRAMMGKLAQCEELLQEVQGFIGDLK